MAGARISISLESDAALRLLRELEFRLGNVAPALRDVGEYLRGDAQNNRLAIPPPLHGLG